MKQLLFFMFIAFMLVSCKNEGTQSRSDIDPNTSGEVQAVKVVCISNGVALRAEPSKEGKWLSSMMLGEVSLFLGESAIDSSDKNREYYKLELSDGSIAWARTYGLLTEAKPAAIIEETAIYTRPDLVTKTDKYFGAAEFVAIVGEKDNWLNVVGAGKKKKGWINADAISTQAEEVAIATLIQKQLIDKNGDLQKNKIADFLEELPYEGTMLEGYLEDLLNEEVEAAIEESIYNYEDLPDDDTNPMDDTQEN